MTKSCAVYYAHTQQADIYIRVKIDTFSNKYWVVQIAFRHGD